MHLNEEELIEMFYGDAHATSRRHLSECSECREKSAEVTRFLSSIPDEAPEPDENWEEQLWRRLDARLPARRTVVMRPRWLAAAAVVVILAGGSLLVLPWISSSDSNGGAEISRELTVDDAARDRMLMFVILRHLDESERMVLELSNTDSSSVGEAQQNLAGELVERNRLYRRSAELAGNTEAARLLGELEMVLLETARGGSTPGSLELIQNLMGEGELLFKMNVLRQEMEQGRWLTENPAI